VSVMSITFSPPVCRTSASKRVRASPIKVRAYAAALPKCQSACAARAGHGHSAQLEANNADVGWSARSPRRTRSRPFERRILRNPFVVAVRGRTELRPPVAEDQREQRLERCRNRVAGRVVRLGIGELAIEKTAQIHPFGPAEDVGSAGLHQRRGVRVARQVRIQRSHQPEIGNAGPSAQKVRMMIEVRLEEVSSAS